MKLSRITVLILGATAMVALPHAVHDERFIPTETMVAKKTSTPRKVLQESERLKILRLASLPSANMASTFTPAIVQNPQELCAAISTDEDGTWKRSEVFAGEWECLSEQFSNTAAEYSIFTIARGPNQDSIKSVRLKLNILGPNQRAISVRRYFETVNALFRVADLEMPAEWSTLPSKEKPFSGSQNGFEIRFFRERTSNESYNITLNWPSKYLATVPGTSERFGPSGFSQ